MSEIIKRNKQIIKLISEGRSYNTISEIFDLSQGRIRQIYARYKIDCAREKIRKKLFKKIKLFDDIHQKWPMHDLVNSLELSLRARRRLEKYFKGLNKGEISLKNLMDSLTPWPDNEGNIHYYYAPVRRQKQLGRILYCSIVDCVTNTYFCNSFTSEWKKRMLIIKRLPYIHHYVKNLTDNKEA